MAVLPHTPQLLYGPWQLGLALDLHTVSSEFIGYDEYGHAQYDTKRTQVGDALYRLKYSQDVSPADDLAETSVSALRSRAAQVDVVVPVPSTRARAVQPWLKSVGESLEFSAFLSPPRRSRALSKSPS